MLSSLASLLVETFGARALNGLDLQALLEPLRTGRGIPRTRGFTVAALNAALPEHSERWTPQSLFIFILAFTRVEPDRNGSGVSVGWLRDPQIVIDLILRNVPDAQHGRTANVQKLLNEECREVHDTLRMMPLRTSNSVRPADATDPERAVRTNLPSLLTSAGLRHAMIAAKTLPRDVVDESRAAIDAGKKRLQDRRDIAMFASALLRGGLSTLETRTVLLERGFNHRDVDPILVQSNR